MQGMPESYWGTFLMKARKFLKPFAASVATLVVSAQAQAAVTAQPAVATSDVNAIGRTASQNRADSEIVLHKAGAAFQLAQDTNHRSHSSHASHSSHSSSSY
jgi:hypothetical protein